MHGISGAAKPIMSYNYGAKQFKRVKKTSNYLLFSVLVYYMIIWTLLMV